MSYKDRIQERKALVIQKGKAAGNGEQSQLDDIDAIELPPAPPWPSLRPEAYHGLLGEIVETIAPESEADPVALLVQLLIASGNAIGRTAHARVEGDQHHCNLFAITVGKSGHGRKGTSWGRVRQVMDIADCQWTRTCIASGLSSGEGLINRVRDPSDDDDGKSDMGVIDKRLLAFETEFGLVLRNLKRESNTLSAIIRAAWDRGDISTLTKKPLCATGAHISAVCHITEPELHRYFDETDFFNGFANRFLWILVKRSKLLPNGGRRLDLHALGQRLQDALVGARRLDELERADETREIWESVYPRLTDSRPGLGGVVTSRAEAQVLRLAVLYAALDASPFIMPAHLHAALAIWDYCEQSAGLIFGSEDRFDKLSTSILEKLVIAADVGLTRNEMSNALGRNAPSEKIVRALGALLETGKARFVKEQNRGRPIERWFAVNYQHRVAALAVTTPPLKPKENVGVARAEAIVADLSRFDRDFRPRSLGGKQRRGGTK